MTVGELLNEFYEKNAIPQDGGGDDKTFKFKVFGITLTLPNPEFRRKVLHIHDIQHILNNCDTSWKGEGFIAGWEISTGMVKHFPLSFLSLWAMGYSLWIHPKAVFNGFRKGLNNIGVIELKINKSAFMRMSFEELQKVTKKDNYTEMGTLQFIEFIFWSVLSQMVLLFPLILISVILWFMN